jgi:two-component system NarL family sensor kinase
VQFGLERAIRSHVEAFQEKHEQLKIHTKMAEDGRLLPEKYRLALYRIYQECLNNVVRHARASEVNISLDVEAHSITLEVADNGCGFQVPTDWVVLARHGHLGLVGMQERAEAIGGQMQVFSEPGSTRVRVSVPLPQEKQG